MPAKGISGLARILWATMLAATGACVASASGAKNWWIDPSGSQALRPGWTAHFGGFQNVGSDFAARLAGQDLAALVPGPLPDPAAFAEHRRGSLAADAFRNSGPEHSFSFDATAPDRSGLLCFRNLNATLFALEAGLRLAYCTQATRGEAASIQQTIAQIQASASRPGAYPRHSGAAIAVQALTPAALRRSLGNDLRVSLDGGRTARLADWRLTSKTAHFVYDSNASATHAGPVTANAATTTHALPRRFPGGEFYALLTGDAFYLLYPIESDPDRLLAIVLRAPDLVREAAATFALLPQLLASHIRHSREGRVALSEVYFRDQSSGSGEIVDEFFEIASGDADVATRIGWSGDGHRDGESPANPPRIEREIFLFSHSTRIFERSADFRLSRTLRFRSGAAADTITIDLNDLPGPEFSHRSWSLKTNPADSSPGSQDLQDSQDSQGPRDARAANSQSAALKLQPSEICRGDLKAYRRLCANPGVGPELAAALQRAAPAAGDTASTLPRCDLTDFALTEFNPVGVFLPPFSGQDSREIAGRVAADGKFVEIRALRSCQTTGIYFRAGPAILDPGEITVSKNRPLLFIASRSPGHYLDTAPSRSTDSNYHSSSAAAQIFSVPALRSTNSADEIAVRRLPSSLAAGADDSAQELIQRILRPATSALIYWSGTGANTATDTHFTPDSPPIYRAVHSLQYTARRSADPGAAVPPRERFSRGPGRGLRPDLRAWNAMSPGRFSDDPASGQIESAANSGRRRISLDVQISEVLPAGGYDASGVSLPAEEFIEVQAIRRSGPDEVPGGSAGLSYPADADLDRAGLELRISKAHANAVHQAIRMPFPERAGYIALQRGPSLCFARDRLTASGTIARLPQLSLPNGAAVYTLHSLEFEPPLSNRNPAIDTFAIDDFAYAGLNAPGRRRSLSRMRARAAFPELMRPTDGAAAASPYCGDRSSATPGGPASFAAFVHREHTAAFRPRLRLYSESGPLILSLRLAVHSLLTPEFQAGLYATHGDPIELPIPSLAAGEVGPRVLYGIYAQDRVLGAGEYFPGAVPLQIHSVSPTPEAGDVEWLRLCAPDGFSPAAYELHVADATTADRIVPYGARFSFEQRANESPWTDANLSGLDPTSLELAAGDCAILVDPDYAGQALPLTAADRALWTIARSNAIGNGLSSGEGLQVYLRSAHDSTRIPLCSYGRPDLPDPFAIHTGAGRYVSRGFDLIAPSPPFDERRLFNVIAP